MDYQKLYEALNTIKECCKESNYCEQCPLSVNEGSVNKGKVNYKCKVGDIEYCDIPRHWKLRTPQYKAFKDLEDTQNASPAN